MSDIILDNGRGVPSKSVVNRQCQNFNGFFIPLESYYVRSGSLSGVAGSSTGSITINLDTFGFKLRRFEVFHSGSSPGFDVSLESRLPNTGSDFDPRKIIAEYRGIKGSVDFTNGVDEVEDLPGLTDASGSLYLNFKPLDAGDNAFKYLLFFEAVGVYINKDNTFA